MNFFNKRQFGFTNWASHRIISFKMGRQTQIAAPQID
jgi:hypothetical protein